MSEEEKQHINLTLTRGTMDAFSDFARALGVKVDRGTRTGEPNVSGVLELIAGAILDEKIKPEDIYQVQMDLGEQP